MKFAQDTYGSAFRDSAKYYYDIPVFRDYYLFTNLLQSPDNVGKNIYYACYDVATDKRLTIAIWDLDCTQGQFWSNEGSYYHHSLVGPELDFRPTLQDHKVFKRLCTTDPSFHGLATERYWELRSTTFNPDMNAYYEPERLGMPFNSPYDDYMMAIDETHQVGWWATNRNASADSVMIYLFLLDDDPGYLDEPTASRARIDNIAETWREEGGYASLIAELMEAPQEVVEEKKLHIIINDDKIYTSEEQFRNSDARRAYQRSVAVEHEIVEQEAALVALRSEYARASAASRKALAPKIERAEESLFALYGRLREAVLRYRRLEQ